MKALIGIAVVVFIGLALIFGWDMWGDGEQSEKKQAASERCYQEWRALDPVMADAWWAKHDPERHSTVGCERGIRYWKSKQEVR